MLFWGLPESICVVGEWGDDARGLRFDKRLRLEGGVRVVLVPMCCPVLAVYSAVGEWV